MNIENLIEGFFTCRSGDLSPKTICYKGDGSLKIKEIKLYHLSVPLKKPFKTALRTVNSAEETIIKIITDSDLIGYGEAPPTSVITGEINEGIRGIIEKKFKPMLIGRDISNIEGILTDLGNAVVGNSSAKAAIDMAVYDLYGKLYDTPLYKLLGGYRDELRTDLTISVNSSEEMSDDALAAIKAGYDTLKIKVGKGINLDLERVKAVRQAVGKKTKIRLDANQGWQAKEAVYIIRKMEDAGLDIELVEQPVKAHDLEGLKFVSDNVLTSIMADESLFSPMDAFHLLDMRACDLLNIKLMKAGGIYRALIINAIAEAKGVEVMLGSMLEAKVSVTAAAHLAAAKRNITRLDLDAPGLLAKDPVIGGIEIDGPSILLPKGAGLGITDVNLNI